MTPVEADHRRLLSLLALKSVPRTGWTRFPIENVESVADHSYGVLLLSWLLCPKELDRQRVLELGLVHDLAEIETGDLSPQCPEPPEGKPAAELAALNKLLFGFSRAHEATALLREYQEGTTPEARWVKAADKLDMTLQSLLYEAGGAGDLSEFRQSSRAALEEFDLDELCELSGANSRTNLGKESQS